MGAELMIRSGALPPAEVAGRVAKLRDRMGDLDALLVTKVVNIRYLTGFTGSAAMLLVLPDEVVFVSDGRYGEQARRQLEAAGVGARIEITGTAQGDVLRSAIAGLERLGLEAQTITWAELQRCQDEWFPGIELVPTRGLVEGLRLVKDAGEVARIRAAAAIADAALAAVLPLLATGPTEREVALQLEIAMRRAGATGPSFETIVASGPNGAKPHHRPTDRAIVAGDLVVLDFGAVVDGYCSDMTRTVCVGGPGDGDVGRMLDVVAQAQAAGVAAVRAGVASVEVDAACRGVIAAAGWADAFVHGTGHGVGLEIHEDPRVSATAGGSLAAGHVVTVEPGVYLPEVGGVRIEDTVVVTETACEVLTLAPKEPILR